MINIPISNMALHRSFILSGLVLASFGMNRVHAENVAAAASGNAVIGVGI